jgi:hypothetical protein
LRSLVALLVISCTIGNGRLLASPQCFEGTLPVTIQIHDYSRVPREALSKASAIVTRLYERIGVRTEWVAVRRPTERRGKSESGGETPRPPIAQLTINVLTTPMASRARVANTALGFAAVATDGMGRIAYVIYDRVRSTAAEAAINEADLLGFVLAHEIGHLLSPRGTHPPAGLMKGRWSVHDFRHLDVLTLGFSETQAAGIRQTIQNDSQVLTSLACGHP